MELMLQRGERDGVTLDDLVEGMILGELAPVLVELFVDQVKGLVIPEHHKQKGTAGFLLDGAQSFGNFRHCPLGGSNIQDVFVEFAVFDEVGIVGKTDRKVARRIEVLAGIGGVPLQGQQIGKNRFVLAVGEPVKDLLYHQYIGELCPVKRQVQIGGIVEPVEAVIVVGGFGAVEVAADRVISTGIVTFLLQIGDKRLLDEGR